MRHVRVHLAQRRGRFVGHAAEDREGRLAVERRRAGRGFVQHAAEAEQIGAVIDFVAAGLLGSHVERRAGDEPRARQFHVFGRPGQAEVGELDAVDRVFEEDVARLDVAVDEPAGVCRGQPGGGLHAEPRDLRLPAASRPA